MIQLILAAVVFVVGHVGVSSTPLRPWLVAWIGERGYLIAFSLGALGLMWWLVIAYGEAPYVELWPFTAGAVWLALLLMLPATFLVVTSLASPNPTAAGVPGELLSAKAARGVFRITRHPFMWGVAVWALAHIIANGDLASLVLLGGLGALALIGTRLIDHKFAARRPDDWRAFADATSNLPFAAIASGRQRLALAEIGWWRLGLSLVVYGLLVRLHPLVIGIDPLASL